jgi:type I restriction enzyme, S subunit
MLKFPKRASWTTVTFGDVVRQVKDKVDPEESGLERYVAGEHMDTGDLRIRRWGEIGDGYLGPAFHMRFKPGHVLYGSRRTYLRKVAVAQFEGITANTTYVLEPKDPKVLLPALLPFIMQTDAFNQHSVRESKGSVNPYVNFSDLAWYKFSLPPVEDQHRIARLLMSQDRMLNALEELRRTLDDAHGAYLEQFLMAEQANLALRPVGDLLTEQPRNGLSPKTTSSETGLRTVSIGAISRGRFDPEGEIKYADITREAAASFLVKVGDIFVVRGNGNRYLTGKAGLAEADYSDLIYPDLLIRLRFDESRILRRFALAQWNLPSVHVRLIARAKSSNGIWKVNGQDIRAHELIAPPMEQQKTVLAALERITRDAANAHRKSESLARMRSAIVRTTLGVDHA